MSEILRVSAETCTRNGQIITLENEGEDDRHFLLINKAQGQTQTGFLCVPIVPATEDIIDEIKGHNRFAPYAEQLSKLFIPMCGQTGLNNAGVDYENETTFQYHALDFQNPVVLIDKGSSAKNLDGRITRAEEPTGLFAAMAKRLTNKLIMSQHQMIGAYQKAFSAQLCSAAGTTFDYGGIVGTYSYDMKWRDIGDWKKRRDANDNLNKHGTTQAPAAAPSAE